MSYFAEGEHGCEILGGLVFGRLHFGVAFELRHGFGHFAMLLQCGGGEECVALAIVVHDVVGEEGPVVLAERQLVEHSLLHWRHVLLPEIHLEIEYLITHYHQISKGQSQRRKGETCIVAVSEESSSSWKW